MPKMAQGEAIEDGAGHSDAQDEHRGYGQDAVNGDIHLLGDSIERVVAEVEDATQRNEGSRGAEGVGIAVGDVRFGWTDVGGGHDGSRHSRC